MRHLADAAKPSYSKILINEIVLPDRGAAWLNTALDLELMSLVGARERTKAEWESIVRAAGLKIVGIFKRAIDDDNVIEIELP